MEKVKLRNQWLDVLKAFACIMVVLIHCMFPGNVGIVCRALARVAVPLFFMVSGYFFYLADRLKMNSRVIKKIKHLLWIALFSGIGYLLLDIVETAYKAKGAFQLSEYLSELVSWESLVRFLFTNTPIVYIPRWFLYALVYCYIFMYFYNKSNIKYKGLYIVSVLLLCGEIVIEVIETLGGTKIILGICDVDISVRLLFLLRALPWFVFGMLWKQYWSFIEKIRMKVCVCVGVIGIVLVVIQAVYMGDFQVYVGTVLMCFSLFTLSLKAVKLKAYKGISYIGEQLSLYVYMIHGAVISIMSLVEELLFENESYIFVWIKSVLVIIVSLIGAWCLNHIVKRITRRKI